MTACRLILCGEPDAFQPLSLPSTISLVTGDPTFFPPQAVTRPFSFRPIPQTMLTHSSTRDLLAPFHIDAGLSPSPSDDKCSTHLKPLPFPVMSRPPTRASTASYSSTMPLNGDHPSNDQPKSFLQRLFGWRKSGKTAFDREAQHLGYPPYDKGGGTGEVPRVGLWHGWRLILRAFNFFVSLFCCVDQVTAAYRAQSLDIHAARRGKHTFMDIQVLTICPCT